MKCVHQNCSVILASKLNFVSPKFTKFAGDVCYVVSPLAIQVSNASGNIFLSKSTSIKNENSTTLLSICVELKKTTVPLCCRKPNNRLFLPMISRIGSDSGQILNFHLQKSILHQPKKKEFPFWTKTKPCMPDISYQIPSPFNKHNSTHNRRQRKRTRVNCYCNLAITSVVIHPKFAKFARDICYVVF